MTSVLPCVVPCALLCWSWCILSSEVCRPLISLYCLSRCEFFVKRRGSSLGTLSASLIKNTIARMPSTRWSISLFDINNEKQERQWRRALLARLPVLLAARTSHLCRRRLIELLLLVLLLLLLHGQAHGSVVSNRYNGSGLRSRAPSLPVETFHSASSENSKSKETRYHE